MPMWNEIQKGDADLMYACNRLVVEGTAIVGRLNKTCQDIVIESAFAESWTDLKWRTTG